MKRCLVILSLLLLFANYLLAHGATADTSLTGTWKGTSICQIKPSACNDEIAIYHITKGAKPNMYQMVMNKEVNGAEEDMGVNEYIFNATDNSLFCFDKKYNLTWKFFKKGNTMEGTLTRDKILYRIIKLQKISDQ